MIRYNNILLPFHRRVRSRRYIGITLRTIRSVLGRTVSILQFREGQVIICISPHRWIIFCRAVISFGRRRIAAVAARVKSLVVAGWARKSVGHVAAILNLVAVKSADNVVATLNGFRDLVMMQRMMMVLVDRAFC